MDSIRLTGSLDVAGVPQWKARLAGSLDCSEVQLDAAGLARTDAAGLQLLCAFVQEVGRRGGRVTWLKPSRSLLKGAELLGLQQALGL